ncbi:DUF6082 family protein [Streptomyces sp. AC1-42T]|uniref:DUF6082 family protein n=1 Tax=Streptomyces sp. AC1-42T TaxID=2218665 RepID=UPI000DAD5AD1|nr:DUF6082 family protein [Streptomyces sp. AC1-42T]PZT71565.1 hypothetical protein DNK55_33205 [Streptomyces sp. AC1-42T]
MLVLFALLLAGVVAVLVTYVVQQREHNRRLLRVEALKGNLAAVTAAAADPELGRIWTGQHDAGDTEVRAQLLVAVRVTALELQWLTGELSKQTLARAAADLLATEGGRRHWALVREARGEAAEDARQRVFHQTFETAFGAAGTPAAA